MFFFSITDTSTEVADFFLLLAPLLYFSFTLLNTSTRERRRLFARRSDNEKKKRQKMHQRTTYFLIIVVDGNRFHEYLFVTRTDAIEYKSPAFPDAEDAVTWASGVENFTRAEAARCGAAHSISGYSGKPSYGCRRHHRRFAGIVYMLCTRSVSWSYTVLQRRSSPILLLSIESLHPFPYYHTATGNYAGTRYWRLDSDGSRKQSWEGQFRMPEK